MRDIWGIHDFVPDYEAFGSTADYLLAQRTGAHIPGGPTGCGYYRITQPLDALTATLGWETAYNHGAPPGDPVSEKIARIIVAQRMDKHEALPYWRRWASRHRLVYEIDDNVFEVDITNWMAFQSYSRSDIREAVGQAAACADLVTVTVEPLAEIMRQFNPEVRVLPNVVPDGVLKIDRLRQPKVVVGWQGGASHARDLALIAPTLRHVLTQHRKRAELHIIGTDYRPTVWDCRPEDLRREHGRFTKWTAIHANLKYFRSFDFDIGLAPLTGSRFDQSKSAIKAIEYNALGIPVLASDCTPYRDFIVDGVNGYLCRRKGDWGRRLEELINDDAAREEMGRRGREMVAANHTMSTGVKQWQSVYEELM